jgi:Ran GTPase-activating protein (RanGAP) involved in mRNA processing and transport
LIIKGVLKNRTLSLLNLSMNNLSDLSCPLLSELLESKSSMHELYLHWNLISSRGSEMLFDRLQTNRSLKVLDVS